MPALVSALVSALLSALVGAVVNALASAVEGADIRSIAGSVLLRDEQAYKVRLVSTGWAFGFCVLGEVHKIGEGCLIDSTVLHWALS